MSAFSVVAAVFVLLIASLVAMISRRLKVAYSVGLVVAGIGVAFIPTGMDVQLTRDLPKIFRCALVARGGGARNDAKPADP